MNDDGLNWIKGYFVNLEVLKLDLWVFCIYLGGMYLPLLKLDAANIIAKNIKLRRRKLFSLLKALKLRFAGERRPGWPYGRQHYP